MRKTDAEIKSEGNETGYLLNCFVKPKINENATALFWQHPGGPLKDVVTCHLDGYAIVPIEEYKNLSLSTEREVIYRKALEYVKKWCDTPDMPMSALYVVARTALNEGEEK